MGFFVDVMELGQAVLLCIIQPVLHTKGQVSHYRPGQALRTPGGEARHSAHEGGKFISPKHRPPLPPPCRRYSLYSFLLGAESTPGPYYGRKYYVNEKSQ